MSRRRFLFLTLIATGGLLLTFIITPYTHSSRHAHYLICSQWTIQLIYYRMSIKEGFYCTARIRDSLFQIAISRIVDRLYKVKYKQWAKVEHCLR